MSQFGRFQCWSSIFITFDPICTFLFAASLASIRVQNDPGIKPSSPHESHLKIFVDGHIRERSHKRVAKTREVYMALWKSLMFVTSSPQVFLEPLVPNSWKEE